MLVGDDREILISAALVVASILHHNHGLGNHSPLPNIVHFVFEQGLEQAQSGRRRCARARDADREASAVAHVGAVAVAEERDQLGDLCLHNGMRV